MALAYRIHPEAENEIADSVDYYIDNASSRIATAFLLEIEAVRDELIQDPRRWRIVETPEIRRAVLQRFPFVIYYRVERNEEVAIYAVMHCSRKLGYWRDRLG